MPPPRITGLLQNCALNSALPILLTGIRELAEREALGTINDLADNSICQNYLRLKNIFSRHYRLEQIQTFNWQAFNTFLTNHSFYANEIIMAPVLRKFIAEMGLNEHYNAADIGLLRDIQSDGVYHNLHYLEAINLYHNHFGITVRTYEYNEGEQVQAGENPQDNYKLLITAVTTNPIYPFGDTPTLDFYYRGAHFEIQPHENLAEANAEYNDEIRRLPDALNNIHNQLSVSQSAYRTNYVLRQLNAYVSNILNPQPPAPVEWLTEPLKRIYKRYAGNYAHRGTRFHENTVLGRQTFALVLLNIAYDRNNIDAPELLDLIDRAQTDQRLPSCLLDNLVKAIINCRSNFNTRRITNISREIEDYLRINREMGVIEHNPDNLNHAALVRAANRTIHLAWQLYTAKPNQYLIKLIKQTQKIALHPTPENRLAYQILCDELAEKQFWSQLLQGLTLTVLGLALIITTSLLLFGTGGTSAPISTTAFYSGCALLTTGMGSLTIGIGFFATSLKTPLQHKLFQIDKALDALNDSEEEFDNNPSSVEIALV